MSVIVANKEFYNMDCMELMAQMPDKCIEMTLTDIPYNLESITNFLTAHDEQGFSVGRKRVKMDKVVNSSVNQLSFNLDNFITELLRITKGTIIIFCSVEQAGDLYRLFHQKTKSGQLRHCLFHKTNAMCLTADLSYMLDTEDFIVYKFPKATFNNHRAPSILSYPMECGNNRIHPTEKNHELLKQLILDNTNKGDLIFDPCMGSGSTCLVALQTGRETMGCEIDKKYFDSALMRLKDRGNYQLDLLEDYN